MYPFHVEHRASSKGYSACIYSVCSQIQGAELLVLSILTAIYVESEILRKEWLAKIKEQLAVRKVEAENNQVSPPLALSFVLMVSDLVLLCSQLFLVQSLAYYPPRRGSLPNAERPMSMARMSDLAVTDVGLDAMPQLSRSSTISSPMKPSMALSQPTRLVSAATLSESTYPTFDMSPTR